MANKAAADGSTQNNGAGEGATAAVAGEGDAFTKLVGELDLMAKGGSCDEAGKDGKGKKKLNADGTPIEEGEPDKGKTPPMAKALTTIKVTDAEGKVIEVEDATEVLKALTDQVEALGAKATASDQNMVKAITPIAAFMKAQLARADAQDVLIKSMDDKIVALGGQGRGRVALITPVKVPAAAEMNKGGAGGGKDGLTPADFMAKAEAAFDLGKLGGSDLVWLESAVNNGAEIPQPLIDKVLLATAAV